VSSGTPVPPARCTVMHSRNGPSGSIFRAVDATENGPTEMTEIAPGWREIVARYSKPSTRAAIIQICTTMLPLAALLAAMYWAMGVHYGLVLLLALPAAGLIVRAFIIMHDCGHGAFFHSRRWNDIVGFVTGVITLTPYVQWRKEHAVHHATSGNLDKRGYGDVSTLTVKEYLALSAWGRFGYRMYRHPAVLLLIGPLWLAIKQRFPSGGSIIGAKERLNVYATDIVLVALAVVAALFGVLDTAAAIYLPAFLLAGSAGVWLFYVQHQFEDTYWRPGTQWDYATSALRGSSYLRLPRVLQWFTGNIGLHHIHHLSPRIPNYRLQRCHEENPVFHEVPTIGFRAGIRSLSLKLWDEEGGRLIRFSELRAARKAAAAANVRIATNG
jgi:acyl-lipid omega-6 desaturase (Delta-12 desaturase)